MTVRKHRPHLVAFLRRRGYNAYEDPSGKVYIESNGVSQPFHLFDWYK
jgi:hypothetical protein